MSATDSNQPTRRHRHAAGNRVRTIEYGRGADRELTVSTFARVVGRVGALAVALGVDGGAAPG